MQLLYVLRQIEFIASLATSEKDVFNFAVLDTNNNLTGGPIFQHKFEKLNF